MTDPTPKAAAIPSADTPQDEQAPTREMPGMDVQVSLNTPIDITLTKAGSTDDPVKVQSPRNMWVLANKLDDMTKELKIDDYELKLATQGTTKDGAKAEVVMAQGPARFVLDSIIKQLVPANITAQLLFSMVKDLLEPTPIRGVLVTAIFEKQQPVAFAVLNHTLGDQLLPEDINMLAYHGQVNLDMFKDRMRKTGHKFPDDNPIIMPPAGGKLILPR